MPDKPGLMTRLMESTSYIIRGVTPSTWFSPMQPLEPMAPDDTKGRQFDYLQGQNLNYRPRSIEPVGFAKLRALAERSNVLRTVIERQKDLIEGFNWQIKPVEQKSGERPPEGKYAADIKMVEDFLQRPDQVHDWAQWLRMVLEDVLVIDAPAIYLRPTRGGDLWGLEPIDGATITPLIDAGGRTPLPPSPAYSQILKGIPATDYGYNELIYYPKNPRTNRLYGSSPVQWIVDTIETSIMRGRSQLAYFTAGNINDGIFTGPDEWGIDQIKQWQRYWDDLFEGNLEARRHGKWVPGGTTFEEIKTAPLKDEFDEWLARVICFAYSTSPAPFIKAQNRSNQEGQQEVAEEGGIKPYLMYLKRLMDRILREGFFMPHLEFVWEMDEEFDIAEAAKIDDLALAKAVMTPDEWRDKRGYDPLPNGLGKMPIVFTASGAQLLSDALKPPEVPSGGDGAGLGEAQGEPGPKKPGSPESPPLTKSQPKRVNVPDIERDMIKRTQAHMARVVGEALAAARDKVLAELEPKLVDSLNKAAGDDPSDDVDDLDLSDVTALGTEVAPMLEGVAADAGQEFLVQIGMVDDGAIVNRVNERAVSFARSRAAELVGKRLVNGELVDSPTAGITETTRELLRGTITRGLADNIGARGILDEIRDSYAFSDERARIIAHTEIARANSQGSLEAAREGADMGIALKKIWLLGQDPCDECLDNADEGAIGLDDEFPSGDDAPPAHPNCYCSLSYEVGE